MHNLEQSQKQWHKSKCGFPKIDSSLSQQCWPGRCVRFSMKNLSSELHAWEDRCFLFEDFEQFWMSIEQPFSQSWLQFCNSQISYLERKTLTNETRAFSITLKPSCQCFTPLYLPSLSPKTVRKYMVSEKGVGIWIRNQFMGFRSHVAIKNVPNHWGRQMITMRKISTRTYRRKHRAIIWTNHR